MASAIPESFGGYGETCVAKNFEHRRIGESDEDDFAVPACDAFRNGGGEFGVVDRLIVKCPVRFDVADFCADFCRDDAECRNLFEDKIGDFAGG